MYKFFEQYNDSDVIAVMSEAKDGNMRIRSDNFKSDVLTNRKVFCQKNGIQYDILVSALTEHTANVAIVDENSERFIENVDALVTKHKNIYLSVTSADCVPVVFYDVKNKIVGIAHAGWRGVVQKIIPHTLDSMEKIGADVQNIHVEIGPGIAQRNFDFGRENMLENFNQYNNDQYIIDGSTADKVKIDLQKIIFDQSVGCGIEKTNMSTCDECTFEESRFFSARREKKSCFNVMMVVIGMQSDV